MAIIATSIMSKLTRAVDQTKFTFGTTSAIVTNLGLIVGLDEGKNAQLHIVGALLVIALADNISDSLGIHMYQESEGLDRKGVWFSTVTNFLSRLCVSAVFVVLVLTLPLGAAVTASIIWGVALLSLMSIFIAKSRNMSVLVALAEHLGLALTVIVLSHLVGQSIAGRFDI